MTFFRRRLPRPPAVELAFTAAVGDASVFGKVRAVAVYDTVDPEGGPEDARALALVWTLPDGAAYLVDHDTYGGADGFDVHTTHALREGDLAPWDALSVVLPESSEGTIDAPGIGVLHVEVQPATLRRAAGQRAAGCPDHALVASGFLDGSEDVNRWWLLLCDDTGAVRRAFAATTSTGRL